MKSANCISATGRSPISPAPMEAPTMAASEMGVSITRRAPKRSRSKSFLCGAMARLAFEEGLCIDVATGGELDIVLRSGVPAKRVIMHGNNKSRQELERALHVGVHRLVVDNFDEIELLRSLVSTRKPLDCLVRVTPGVEAHTHEFVRTGQEDTKFGFSVATGEARSAINTLRGIPGLTLHGVHAHIGSQIF